MAGERKGVFIVGGGPAGLATAIALRARGFAVTVADPARPPIDKPCGEGLMPSALAALRRLDVTLPEEHCHPFRGIRFVGGGASVDASFPNGTGVGIRRTHLHQALIDRAEQAGARLLWGVPVKGLEQAAGYRWVIGADGENSRVRHWAGLDATRSRSIRYGFRRHYGIAPWSDCVEIHWGSGCQIYVTPIAAGEICAVVISRDPHLRLDEALLGFPELSARLRGAPATTTERGAVSASRSLSRVCRDRVLLVGDASGSVDAITGDGMRLGFEQALALADAIAHDDPAAYAAAHRRLARRPALMAALMLSLDRSAWLRDRVLQALSADPSIFAAQLAMHVGATTTGDFLRHSMLPLGRHLLTAA